MSSGGVLFRSQRTERSTKTRSAKTRGRTKMQLHERRAKSVVLKTAREREEREVRSASISCERDYFLDMVNALRSRKHKSDDF